MIAAGCDDGQVGYIARPERGVMIDAARRRLETHEQCTGRIGVIGFCLGCGFALMTASRYDFAVASVNYGEVPDDITSVEQRRRDRRVPGAREHRLTTCLLVGAGAVVLTARACLVYDVRLHLWRMALVRARSLELANRVVHQGRGPSRAPASAGA